MDQNPVPLRGALDWQDDGGRAQCAQTAQKNRECSHQKDTPKPGSHLDNKHYLGAISGIDAYRAFGNQR